MPRYDFRCGCSAEFTATYPMSAVPEVADCPRCGERARRRLTAPHLSRTGSAAFGLIDRAARSAHEPEVVSGSLPGRRRRPGTPVTSNPLHAKLPRT
ncbi:FmdB family zinc ribbon protein [Microbacterium sp.]|uniref:FmdB family zinc ribbon protein n=1 Tax=Microbacterium sp. TaxID=51671 RepID=UPI0037C522EE